MYEFRWLQTKSYKVLQYRFKEQVKDYTYTDSTGNFLTSMIWSEWTDVPTVNRSIADTQEK